MISRFPRFIAILLMICLWSSYGPQIACGQSNFSVDADTIAQPVLSELIQQFSLSDQPCTKIDDVAKTLVIKVDYPCYTKDKMVVRYKLADGYDLYLGDQLLSSGRSIHDFTSPVVLNLIGADGVVIPVTVAVVFGDLPSLFLSTENNEWITSKEEYLKITNACLVNSSCDTIFFNGRIKGRGNTTWNQPKKSYTLKLDKKSKLLGMKKHKTYALIANYSDKTLLRNVLAYYLGRNLYDSMSWNPTTAPVNLFVNGKFLGLYTLTETAKIDGNRIDIPNIEDCKSIDNVAVYGYLLEINKLYDEDYNFTTPKGVPISLKDPEGNDIADEYKEHIQQQVLQFEEALFSNSYKDTTTENYYGRYMDVNSLIDWYLVNEIAKNHDAQTHSSIFFYYNPADSLFHMGPLWDFDLAFGNINYGGCDSPEDYYVRKGIWLSRIFNDRNFLSMVKERYLECREQIQQCIYHWIQDQADILAVDADVNFARWPILGTYTWPNPDGYEERTTYQSEVDYMIDWLDLRLHWLDSKYGVQVRSVSLDADQLRLVEGMTTELTAVIAPANASLQQVYWKSSDPEVVTVDDQGLVTAVAKGNAEVTATCGIRSAVCEVMVGKTTAIDAVETDMPTEYFTLSGIKVDGSRLAPGFYIQRTGTAATKILVK